MVAPARPAPPHGPRLALAPLWYACGGLMLAAVAVVSLLPMPDTGVNDKFAHVVVYCGLSGYFALLVTRRSLPWVTSRRRHTPGMSARQMVRSRGLPNPET